MLPKISIITPSFNQGKYIRDTIESVLSQNYSNWEHIIIDGASKDDTVSILKEYDHLKWISEKDEGPADAIIKGFNLADGDIFTWLNSDDYFCNSALMKIVAEINSGYNMVVGNMIVVSDKKEYLYENKNNDIYNFEYLVKVNSDIIKQPSTFFTKKLYFETGGIDKSLKIVFDYDLFLKMLKITKPSFLDIPLAYQRIYDDTLTLRSLRKQSKEIFKVSRQNGAGILDPIMKSILKKYIFPDSYGKSPGIIYKSLKTVSEFFR
ncbi:MAG: glycosyltransferase [Ignavibacteria bacterium]|nr:glycosyltransferase [Ignavibacteria bacterium]